ncbi:hypothetical protein [Stenotrophomonas sp. PS02289]|uniref:hypothetical protein n=1 Tax=Stenotrophomonas sp. PS02289 TaxID=2991422 RepID=UPI00249CD22B|nr:hypothetical protein [Stenotrophomonas sp. PS02289]
MRNASLHSRHLRACRTAPLMLLLPFALATAQAQEATDAPVAASAKVEQPAAPVDTVAEAPAPAQESIDAAQADAILTARAADAAAAAAEAAAGTPSTTVAPAAAAAEPAPAEVATPAPAPAPATAPTTASEASAPEVPTAPPAPRPLVVPVLANADNAIERQLGARCPNDLAARLATQDNLLTGACQGTMPAHLANVLKAIPEQDLLLPRSARERQLSQKAWFKAVPGYGVRPDFIAVQNGLWVRSFEGADASTTVYLVSGPFTCVDGRYPDAIDGKTVRLTTGSCREALVQQRVYQVTAGAAPQDITAQALPAQPLLSDADRKRYNLEANAVQLDPGKLQFGPALRWYAEVPADSKPEARSYGEWGHLHLGFIVWNGERFEQRDTVPRGLWACDPVAPGDAACSGYADAGRDPFVVNSTTVAGQSAAP